LDHSEAKTNKNMPPKILLITGQMMRVAPKEKQ
jgi:hypothetical protein